MRTMPCRAMVSSHAPAKSGETLLAVCAVSKHFGGVRAVEDMSLEVRRGGLTSIIGPEWRRQDLAPKHHQRLLPAGYRLGLVRGLRRDRDASPSDIAALGIARTFQNIALFSGMTVLNNIMLGRHVRMRAGVLSSIVYWGLAQREEVAHRARVEELIELLGEEDLRKQPTSGLAYGLRKPGRAGARAGARPQTAAAR